MIRILSIIIIAFVCLSTSHSQEWEAVYSDPFGTLIQSEQGFTVLNAETITEEEIVSLLHSQSRLRMHKGSIQMIKVNCTRDEIQTFFWKAYQEVKSYWEKRYPAHNIVFVRPTTPGKKIVGVRDIHATIRLGKLNRNGERTLLFGFSAVKKSKI